MAAMLHRLRDDSLLRNSAYNMAVTTVTALLGYVYWIVAARLYAVRDVGAAAALISALTLASLVANLGAGPTLIAVLPRRASGRPWSLALNAALGVSGLAGLVAGLVGAALVSGVAPGLAIAREGSLVLLVFVAGVALWTVATTIDNAFVAERAAGHMLLRNGLFALLKIPLLAAPALLAVATPHVKEVGILSSWVLATGASLIVARRSIRRLGRGYRPVVRGALGEARALLSSFAGQHAVTVGAAAPMYLLPLLVAARLSSADNAYFYTSWKVGSLFFMVSPAVAASLFAEGAYRRAALSRQARRAALAIAALLTPTLLLFACGMSALMGFFGPDYPRHSAPLLSLLMLSAAPDALTNIYVSVLRVRGQLRLAAVLNVGMAGTSVALAWLWLPPLGIAGAGWAWLTAQLLGCLFVGAHALLTRTYKRRLATAVAMRGGLRRADI